MRNERNPAQQYTMWDQAARHYREIAFLRLELRQIAHLTLETMDALDRLLSVLGVHRAIVESVAHSDGRWTPVEE